MTGNRTDKELRDLVRSVVDDAINRTFHLVADAFDHAVFNNVPGDYLEFGVRGGPSFLLAWYSYVDMRHQLVSNPGLTAEARAALPTMARFFAFDAFDVGLPAPAGGDDNDLRPAHWTEASMQYPVEDFRNRCRQAGLPDELLRVVPGYFRDTLTPALRAEHDLQAAAVIHLDCDLYESTREALAFCTDLVQLGTILVFDDFFRFRGSEDHGQFKAFAEWRAENPGLSFRELSRFRGAVSFVCSRVS